MSHHTRLSIVVIVVAAVLLQANAALEFFTTRRSFNEQLTEKAQRDLNESHRIAAIKQEVEAAVSDALPSLARHAERQDADSLRLALRRLSVSQEQIAGVAVAFVPGYMLSHAATHDGRQGLYGLYVYEETEAAPGQAPKITEKTLDFDYTRRSWFQRALQGHASWSEPYEAKYLCVLMSAYSVAMTDSTGRTVAVVEADVPLRELSAMAAQFYENQERAALRNIVLQLLGLLLLAFIIWRTVGHLRRLQAVNAEKERIASELSVASGIQQSMIPKTFPGYPDRDDIELYASLTPAREVGGDFYDFVISDERLFFCIGDVSGKGVPAALLMTVMRSLFRTEAGREAGNAGNPANAAAIVRRMNATLTSEQDSGYFATMFVGVLNLASGHLDYCNAGHERPLVIHAALAGQGVKGVNSFNSLNSFNSPKSPNIPVGALPDWEYTGATMTLHEGDTLFLFTDGLSEARDHNGHSLSRQRVADVARQAAGLSPRELVECMDTEARHHAGGVAQSDDITLMALRWQGRNTLSLQTDGGDLQRLKGFVQRTARRAHLDDHQTQRVRLAVEEAVTNVINHAHASTLTLASAVRDGQFLLTIADDGRPFDPTQAPVADTDRRDVGGLGLLFIHQMSDNVSYQRHEGQNILTIQKTI